jgi:hypothetical protein
LSDAAPGQNRWTQKYQMSKSKCQMMDALRAVIDSQPVPGQNYCQTVPILHLTFVIYHLLCRHAYHASVEMRDCPVQGIYRQDPGNL